MVLSLNCRQCSKKVSIFLLILIPGETLFILHCQCKGQGSNPGPFHHSTSKCSAPTIGATATSLCLVKLISFVYGVVIKLQVVLKKVSFFLILMLNENLFILHSRCRGLGSNPHPISHSTPKCSALTIGASAASLCLVKLISFVYGVVIKLQVVLEKKFQFFC